MKDSKLISILKSFSKEEIKSFEKFIISPYFSVGRDVNGLFSEVKKNYPGFGSDEFVQEIIFSKMYPNEPFNEMKFKNIASALTNLAEQFLVHNYLRSNEIEYQTFLSKQYTERNNDKLFLSALKVLEGKVSSAPPIGIERIQKRNEAVKLREKFFIRKNKFTESVPLRLEQADSSSLLFLINHFKKLRDTIILPLFYNTPFNSALLTALAENIDFDGMINKLRQERYDKLWIIEIYHSLYRAILLHSEPVSETYYEKGKELFYSKISQFSKTEKLYLFDSLTTYCVMRDPVDQRFTRECFEVYKKMLDENIYSSDEKGSMSTTVYGNIMLWSLDVYEYDWLEWFIENFSEKLNPEHRENMTNFAKANLYFGKRDFEKALEHISRVTHDFLLYKIQVRNLKFKIFYELSMFEQAVSLVDSYRHFLSGSSEIHETFKTRAVDFINIYSKLLNAKATGNLTEIDSIKQKVESMLGYELRPWLNEKVDELIKNN